MSQSRRQWFRAIPGALGFLVFADFAMAQRPSAQPMPSPNAPNEHAPAGLDRPPIGSSGDKRGLDPQLELQIKNDVEQLFVLASDLKKQVESTDLNSVLSLGIVTKAKQIEKLAKHIREHAKG